jgi:hypothetical protein
MRPLLLIALVALLVACGHAQQIPTQAKPPAPGTDRARTAMIDGFVTRLAAVADAGEMFDVDATMRRLDLPYRAVTADSIALPPNCHVDWHPRQATRTTVTVDTPSWYTPSPFVWLPTATPSNHVPPLTFEYAVDHTVRCTDHFLMQDSTKAALKFTSLPRFACITKADIVHALPTAHVSGGSLGAPFTLTLFGTQGRTNDDFAAWLTFSFYRDSPCAATVEVKQDQEQGLRFKRALWNHALCIAEEQHDYCVAHGGVDISSTDLKGIYAYVDEHCPSVNAMYLKEPHTGQPPPSSGFGNWNRRNPCGF